MLDLDLVWLVEDRAGMCECGARTRWWSRKLQDAVCRDCQDDLGISP